MSNNTPKLSHNDQLVSTLFQRKLQGDELTLKDVTSQIKIDEDYTKIKDWAVKEKICTYKEFDAQIKNKKNFDVLNGHPETVTEFVDLYTKKNNISISYKKEIRKSTQVSKIKNKYLSEFIKLEEEKNLCEDTKKPFTGGAFLRQARENLDTATKVSNVNDVARRLRIISKELDLSFGPTDIDDVLQEWIIDQQLERKSEIFRDISYTRGMKGIESEFYWYELATSFFDFDTELDLSLYAKVSALKHFIYQVKRKMRNLPVNDHMMVVLLGPQGVGKSTFMKDFLAPLDELVVNSDFRQISDDRNIDLWDHYVVKTDEMGWASRSDIDVIKNLITAENMNRRIMRSNNSVPVKQNATFMGASNRELNQLVRDETGARRFIGIRIKANPQWNRMAKIDFKSLWRSIDEELSSPIYDYMDEIKIYQEQVRMETSCERWANTLDSNQFNSKISANILFSHYKDWESINYSKKKMDFDDWQSEMLRLESVDTTFPFISINCGISYDFKFIKERADVRKSSNKIKLDKIEELRISRNKDFAQFKINETESFKTMDSEYDANNDDDVIHYISENKKTKKEIALNTLIESDNKEPDDKESIIIGNTVIDKIDTQAETKMDIKSFAARALENLMKNGKSDR